MSKNKLRALLVGVTDYTQPPPGATVTLPAGAYVHVGDQSVSLSNPVSKPLVKEEFSADMRSAALDVAEMLRLVRGLTPKPYATAEVLVLMDKAETTRAAILDGIRWLFEDAGEEHQLVFYFSGHGGLRADAQEKFCDEVLLPSDHDWGAQATTGNQPVIRDRDLLSDDAQRALRRGACLEVILESCSATDFIGSNLILRKFGCYFGGNTFPAGTGAVWSASLLQQNSHSGPVPSPCPPADGVPVQGLFTYFFCTLFHGRTRVELLRAIAGELDAYREKYNSCCAPQHLPMGPQAPSLYTTTKMTAGSAQVLGGDQGRPLSGDCAALGGSAVGGLPKPPSPITVAAPLSAAEWASIKSSECPSRIQ